MNNRTSQRDKTARAKSDAIDKQIEKDRKRYKRECKILLLGLNDSEKSAIVKQMEMHYQSSFSDDELSLYKPIVCKNVVDSARDMVMALKKIGLNPINRNEMSVIEKITHYSPVDHNLSVTSEVADAIHQVYQVWQDPFLQKIVDEHRSEIYFTDSAEYFLANVLRIGTPDYIPNVKDVLRARDESTGIRETRFNMEKLSVRMLDIEIQRFQRYEVRKWIHYFQDVTSIIFCTAMSDYDQVLLKNRLQNQMEESLTLFESVINSRWFLRTSIILFLTKIDVFKIKLPRVPLENYFPEYTGGNDINKAAKYILWRFVQTNRARLSIYPHLTYASDPMNIKLISTAVEETILQNARRDSKIL